MSEADRVKWDARYTCRSHVDVMNPCGVLQQHVQLAPPGRALDLACGAGRNALFMARRGFAVDALDVSPVGLAWGRRAAVQAGLDINWRCMDLLEKPRIPGDGYALILMCHFIAPELLERLPGYLISGGVLMVEEHLIWPEPVTGPRSDRFRVKPGTLRAAFMGADPALEVLVDTEGLVEQGGGEYAALARLVVRKA